MTIVDKPLEKSDFESVRCTHTGSLTPFSSGDMDGSSSSWSVSSSATELMRAKTACTAPSIGTAVYGSTTSLQNERPQEQVMSCGDGIALPQKVLFPPDRLSLKWNQVHRIGAGLQNLGNTCFLNSALQCLSYTAPLANYMLTREHSKSCHESGFCMMCTMQNHITQVFANSGNVIKPIGVLNELKRIAKHFRFGSQEDAHEFLRYTVEAMQKSCLPGNSLDRQTQATTLIHQIFGGYLRSRVKCLNCKGVSDTFDPYLDIALDIKNAPSITKALEQFVKPEQLDGDNAYKCSKCMKMVQASKKFTIHRSSNVLTISLKRFANFSGGKISKDVRYPEYLDLRPYMSQSSEEPQHYGLYAVLVHSGFSCYAGHYYCYVKASNGQWYQMNDSSVSASDIRSVLNQQAYLLFYSRSTELKNGDFNHTTRTPGQSSPRPLITPKTNGLQYTSSSFIGPQLPPHMVKKYVNGNGTSKDYQNSSIPSSSNSNGATKTSSSSSPSTFSSSSSASTSSKLIRPTCIPEPQKRPKLTILIGQSKVVRPGQNQPSSSCASSSASQSHPQSSSFSTRTAQPTSKLQSSMQVNGTSVHHSAAFLVPYSQESSEESDQDAGVLDKGKAKAVNNESATENSTQDSSSSYTSKVNSIKSTETHTDKDGSGLSDQNGHHLVNGFKHSDKITESSNSESSITSDTDSSDSQIRHNSASSKLDDIPSPSLSTERAKPPPDLTQPATPILSNKAMTNQTEMTPATPTTLIDTSNHINDIPAPPQNSQGLDQQVSNHEVITASNGPHAAPKPLFCGDVKDEIKSPQSGKHSSLSGTETTEDQDGNTDVKQPSVSTSTKNRDRDKVSHRHCREYEDKRRDHYGRSHRPDREPRSYKERSSSREKRHRDGDRHWDRQKYHQRGHYYKWSRVDWVRDWERDKDRRYQYSSYDAYRTSHHYYREGGPSHWRRIREDSRDRWHYNREPNNRTRTTSPYSRSPSADDDRTHRRSHEDTRKHRKSKKKSRDKYRDSEMSNSDRNGDSSHRRHKSKKKKRRRYEADDRSHTESPDERDWKSKSDDERGSRKRCRSSDREDVLPRAKRPSTENLYLLNGHTDDGVMHHSESVRHKNFDEQMKYRTSQHISTNSSGKTLLCREDGHTSTVPCR